MSNYIGSNYEKMSIDESFKSSKRKDLKDSYKLKLDSEEKCTDRREVLFRRF